MGFRAGTAQTFCPPSADYLLELPLSIQDTALFYPDRMDLSEAEALESCKKLIEFASLFGGALTVNWHTRSLSPERLWGDFYLRLLEQMQTFRVWFGTGAEIVRWFRSRRALCFERVQFDGNRVHLCLSGVPLNGQPSFLLRIHQPKLAAPVDTTFPAWAPASSEMDWRGETVLEIAS